MVAASDDGNAYREGGLANVTTSPITTPRITRHHTTSPFHHHHEECSLHTHIIITLTHYMPTPYNGSLSHTHKYFIKNNNNNFGHTSYHCYHWSSCRYYIIIEERLTGYYIIAMTCHYYGDITFITLLRRHQTLYVLLLATLRHTGATAR